ncbi:2Fe-2S iron-sulfur cluster-binding protein [Streptomyces fulvoviolaceus]|uniref:2Fe-2S iron-sulfur cluster-binding protein n=1 Tax=Streptomyces fulvoviolaceus TaxID=285535 RepID=UPI0004CBB8F9|nr:2Fe-2S iron-sulfur cluster binding domain-containing protein [Streptomyces fulvoviolaceus]
MDDGSFEVLLAKSGRTVRVPRGESVLDVLEAHGVDVQWLCRSGICGTCETAVLAGEPEHHDSVLSGAERASGRVMMVCVSRSRSAKLVLEL